MGLFDGLARTLSTAINALGCRAGAIGQGFGAGPARDFLHQTAMGKEARVLPGITPLLEQSTAATRSIDALAGSSADFGALTIGFLAQLEAHPANFISEAPLRCAAAMLRHLHSSNELARVGCSLRSHRGGVEHPARAVGLVNLTHVLAQRHAALVRAQLEQATAPRPSATQ